MRLDVYVPVLASILLGAGVPVLARRLPPATAARLLVTAGIGAALGWGWALALLMWTAAGRLSFVAAEGHWSTGVLRAHDPVAGPVAWTAGVVLAAVSAAAVTVTVRRGRATWLAWRLAGAIRPAAGDLVVVTDPIPHACALPGRRGRVVVSAGMLRALDAAERRVLFAHERSHLRHRHDLWVSAAHLAAAANPVLAMLPGTVELLVERWADEDAAHDVADRRLTARAIARAGLATIHADAGRGTGGVALAAASSHVQARLAALSRAPGSGGRPLVALVAVALTLTAAAAIDAGRDTENLFESAMHAHHRLHHPDGAGVAAESIPAGHRDLRRPGQSADIRVPAAPRRSATSAREAGPPPSQVSGNVPTSAGYTATADIVLRKWIST